jgi:hypothetical protein
VRHREIYTKNLFTQASIFRFNRTFTGAKMTEKSYFLYKTVDLSTGNYYIGVHATRKPFADNYQGSGDWIKECREHGVHLITGIIEFVGTERDAYTREAAIVTWARIHTDPLMKNRVPGGFGGWPAMTPEKCAERNRRIQTDEERKKRSDTLTAHYKTVPHHTTGKPKSAEQRLEMSKSQRGRTFSAETRKKMSDSHKARNALLGIKPVPPITKGLKRNHKERECPICGILGKGGNMTRYHFDNCKN